MCVNPAVILGPNDQKPSASMGTITNYLFDPLKLTWPGGVNIVHAEDCARGHVLLADKGESGERYLPWGPITGAGQRVHETISHLCNVAKPTIKLNAKTALLGASLMELGAKFTGKPPQATRDQAMQVGNYFGTITPKRPDLDTVLAPPETLFWTRLRGSWTART